MNRWGIDWKSKTTIAVVLFLALAAWMFSQDANAADTAFEIAPGTAFIGSSRYTGAYFALEERLKDKYALGVGLTTELTCVNKCRDGDSPNNQFIYAQRVVSKGKFELGLGVSYWHKQTPAWNSNTPYALSIGWNFNDHASIKWRHFSTAGSSSTNRGLDLVTFGWRF